ncbi:MAG TPA: gliding motility-associated C-terminal domain-containing protein [Chitinophagaceae bacterium]|nr:gliding motility-associated C-terminal domain-containing protein [Chitinophagaceae bacterium]
MQPNDPAGTATNLTVDDTYSGVINLGFPFPFYGNIYNSLVASTNGYLSFDVSRAGQMAAWQINNDLPSTSYDRAMIMGPNHDLYPGQPTSPTQRIQYQVFGVAPQRRWILSYYKVPLFSCTSSIENTHQIILYESTGIVEVTIFSKQICIGWNSGRAIVGIQDFNRTQGMMAPGRAALANPPWGTVGMNESWRFVPNSGPSLFKRVELYDLSGTLISTGTTTNLGNGRLEASFPNVCPSSGGTTTYIVRSVYEKIDDPTVEIFGNDTVNVIRSADQQADVTSSATSCSGATNGTITVTPTNGTGPYTYSLDGAPAVAGTAPYTFMNVPAGSHNVVVFDAFGCVSVPLPVTVAAGPPLSTTVNKTDALCNGTPTGTITVTQPSTGVPPYEYSLDGVTWQASNTFTGLPAGVYTVYYREGAGCQGSQTITINEPATLGASVISTAVICNGQNNGTITVTATGGVSPYQYSLDGGTTWQAGNVFTVPAGNYTVTIRDINNCLTTQNITVTEPAALTANSANSNASCDGGNDGTITVNANGGNTGGYQYSIDGTTFQSSNIFNVGPGNYTIWVKDNQGCTTTFNTTVGLTNNLTFTPQTDPVICEGTSTQLSLNSNGTIYSWSPSTGLSDTTIYNPTANPIVTTQYIVSTTLGRCSAKDTVIVNVNAAPIPNAGADGFICYGQTYQLQGSGGTQYSWSPSTYLDDPLKPNAVSSAPKDIIYTLSIVSDINGCASLVTDEMRLDVTPPIKVQTFPFDTVAYSTDIFQLLAVPSDSDVINYSWSPSIGLDNPFIANPIVTAGAIGDVVQYQVTTSTIAGCKGYGYVTVKVYKGPDLYVPTGFTPNNDGKNDKFTPFPVGIKELKYFRVFNRWGQMVFSTKQLHDGWDGRLQGTEQPTGTYVWMAEAVTNEDKIITKKGVVTLIR